MSESVFAPESVDANLGGALSAEQRRQLEALVDRNYWRVLRHALRPLDPLAKDLQTGRVESIEGAVSKRTEGIWDQGVTAALTSIPVTSAPATYISVANRQHGDQEFRSDRWVYEFAPDAGMVRLFYLPRSRRVVNLELLPDMPVDASPDGMQRAVEEFAAAPHDKVAAAEARARMAAIDHELKSYLPDKTSLSSDSAKPAVSAKEIHGDWTSPFLSLSIGEDGMFATRMPDGSHSEGHWSLDSGGRLHAEFMGAPITADVSIDGDELTLVFDSQAIRLRRAASD